MSTVNTSHYYVDDVGHSLYHHIIYDIKDNYITETAVFLQEDASDCGRACGLVRPSVLSVGLLTALTFTITMLVVGGGSTVQ